MATGFEDETGAPVTPPFSIDDLMPMDFVRVEGQEILNNEVLATVVKRRNGPDNELKLEGQVDGYMQDDWIRVLGVEYQLILGTTSYEPPLPIITVGDFVEIEDDNNSPPADGIADKVEVE